MQTGKTSQDISAYESGNFFSFSSPFHIPITFTRYTYNHSKGNDTEQERLMYRTEPLIYLSFYDTEMPPHPPLCGGSSEKNAAHRSCNSEAAPDLISETIGSQNNFNSCPLISQSVQGNICFTKSAGSVQYLLHPPCGVLYNLISFLLKASFCSGRFFLFGRRRAAAAYRSIVCLGKTHTAR